MRDTEKGRDIGRGREAGSLWGAQFGTPSQDPSDHTLSWKQTLNHWATQASPCGNELPQDRTGWGGPTQNG